MPSAPLRYCAFPGCGERTTQGRCEAHRKQHGEQKDRSRKRTEHRWVYNSVAWHRLKQVILSASPICAICQRAWAREVDHIVPMYDGGEQFDAANLQALCKPCHSRKTRREMRAAASGS